ncbi:MAG: hypothetical protein PSN04_00295 [Methyloprofundus sp.]|nr:hypothetical protein [Methyloprofundus sp.]
MDLNFLSATLKTTLEQYHTESSLRYCNVGFSSKSLRDLDDITQTLRALLPRYALWQQPTMQSTPELIVSRKLFEAKILATPEEGVIIHQPEQWLNQWSLLEKQAFWSTIAMWHSAKKLVLVFAESNEFQIINNTYFKEKSLDGLAIKLWRPARAD